MVTRSRSSKYRRSRHYVLKFPGDGKLWWGGMLVIGFGVVLIFLLLGEKNLLKVWTLHQEQTAFLLQMETVKAENQKLTQQIEALKKDPRAVERIAREELGMIGPNEMVYRFVPRSRTAEKNRE